MLLKQTNGLAAVLHEPMAAKPAKARQYGRGIWLYIGRFATGIQVTSTEATTELCSLFSMARNAVLVPVFQGTEVTLVTEYVPFQYFTRTASKTHMGTQFNHAMLRREDDQRNQT